MAKISSYPAVSAVGGADQIPVVQSGGNKRMTPAQLRSYVFPASLASDVTGNLPITRLNNGAGADSTKFWCGDGTWSVPAASPTPDFQTYCQAQYDAGQQVNWIWGDILLNAPVVVNFTTNNNNFLVNLNGALISPSSSYPVNTAVDMVTFRIPDSAPSNTNVQGFRVLNGHFIGKNPSLVSVCRNCLFIGCHLNVSGIYNGSVAFCMFNGAARSGVQLYGCVFEWDMAFNGGRDNGFAGIELRNPNGAGAGILSSINIWGGDLRTNLYGLAATAETAFQEPAGIHVHSTNFIVNASAGIYATSGIGSIRSCHFENNCNTSGGLTRGAILIDGGHCQQISVCDAPANNGKQLYLLDIAGPGTYQVTTMTECVCFNENTGDPLKLARLSAAGTLVLSTMELAADLIGSGGWDLKIISAASSTI